MEKKKDYVSAFKLNMTHPKLRPSIFDWITRTFDKLSRNGKTLQPFNELKTAIQRSVKELIQLNEGLCVELLDKWFEDEY